MKKYILKDEFIEMRAQGFTLDEIAKELSISKPTAVKWAKEFADEIEIEQVDEYAKYLIGEIHEHEETLYYHIENFRRSATSMKEKPGLKRYTEKAFKRLRNVFKQRVLATTFVLDKKTKKITSITFTFKKSTNVNISTKYKYYDVITYR